jgi:hypothetical protein
MKWHDQVSFNIFVERFTGEKAGGFQSALGQNATVFQMIVGKRNLFTAATIDTQVKWSDLLIP